LYCFVAFHSAKLNFSLLTAAFPWIGRGNFNKKRSAAGAVGLISRYGFLLGL
jgi:hypothetical protein